MDGLSVEHSRLLLHQLLLCEMINVSPQIYVGRKEAPYTPILRHILWLSEINMKVLA